MLRFVELGGEAATSRGCAMTEGMRPAESTVDALTEPPLDYDRLRAGLGQEPGMLRELIPIFLEDSPACLDRLGAAIRAGDPRGVRREGHTLAGNASTFAAAAVTALARRLECMGAGQNLDGAGEVFASLLTAFDRVRPLLEVCAVESEPAAARDDV
jgi:HPt (histidine-containing phosphotransfer) domain-containing protein